MAAELFRSRDLIVFFKGATITVDVTETDSVQGWRGGQGFQWAPPLGDQLLATVSDGLYGGFALWGSDEEADEFTSMTRNQPTYRFVVLGAGGWLIATSSYERYTYASRTGPGPLVPITYAPSDRLVFSLRGFFTKEDEWTLSGDPRAPNNYYIAFVAQKPTPERNDYLTLQVSI
jgi:hypothetical protein